MRTKPCICKGSPVCEVCGGLGFTWVENKSGPNSQNKSRKKFYPAAPPGSLGNPTTNKKPVEKDILASKPVNSKERFQNIVSNPYSEELKPCKDSNENDSLTKSLSAPLGSLEVPKNEIFPVKEEPLKNGPVNSKESKERKAGRPSSRRINQHKKVDEHGNLTHLRFMTLCKHFDISADRLFSLFRILGVEEELFRYKARIPIEICEKVRQLLKDGY